MYIQILALFPEVHIREAYTGNYLCHAIVNKDGTLSNKRKLVTAHVFQTMADSTGLASIEQAKIAEIRLLANEHPIVYYETENSLKALRLPSEDRS